MGFCLALRSSQGIGFSVLLFWLGSACSEGFSPDFLLSSVSAGSWALLYKYEGFLEKKAASCVSLCWDRALTAGLFSCQKPDRLYPYFPLTPSERNGTIWVWALILLCLHLDKLWWLMWLIFNHSCVIIETRWPCSASYVAVPRWMWWIWYPLVALQYSPVGLKCYTENKV